jgi:hypothetical protein
MLPLLLESCLQLLHLLLQVLHRQAQAGDGAVVVVSASDDAFYLICQSTRMQTLGHEIARRMRLHGSPVFDLSSGREHQHDV